MANFTGQNFESVKAELEEKYKQVTVNYIENDKPKGEIVEQIPTPDPDGYRSGARTENLGK